MQTKLVTHRSVKDIEKIKSENDLLYLINGEINHTELILLAESTKAGTLKLKIAQGDTIDYSLIPFKATRIQVQVPFNNQNDIEYEFSFSPEDNSLSVPQAGTGRFSRIPVPGQSFENDPKIAVISCNDVMQDYTGNLKLWKEIQNIKTDIKFLIGDQIYGDPVLFNDGNYAYIWQNFDNLSPQEIKSRYDNLYRITYHLNQEALRNGMNIMMPDDHETFDGAGTPGFYDFNDKDRINGMKAAYESFKEHQMALRIDPSDTIYLHRKFGDIEYVGLDTGYDRFPAVWKKHI